MPATPGGRQAALRHAADRVETAITGLEQPLSRYLQCHDRQRDQAGQDQDPVGTHGKARCHNGTCTRNVTDIFSQ